MTTEQRNITPEELRLLARIAGIEIAEERIAAAAEQVSMVYRSLSRLNIPDLKDVEPAASFQVRQI
ncbi:MAG: hypothetical protein VX800_03225 [Chloroflexota bacterium]|nr:hypothetical protein [Chloroflexota bacterium]